MSLDKYVAGGLYYSDRAIAQMNLVACINDGASANGGRVGQIAPADIGVISSSRVEGARSVGL